MSNVCQFKSFFIFIFLLEAHTRNETENMKRKLRPQTQTFQKFMLLVLWYFWSFLISQCSFYLLLSPENAKPEKNVCKIPPPTQKYQINLYSGLEKAKFNNSLLYESSISLIWKLETLATSKLNLHTKAENQQRRWFVRPEVLD